MGKKTKITEKEVEYAARLARLELTAGEKEKFAGQLESIFEYIDKLDKLDTENILPTSHVLGLKNIWREDKVVNCPQKIRNDMLNNAPERENDFYKVKKVIE